MSLPPGESYNDTVQRLIKIGHDQATATARARELHNMSGSSGGGILDSARNIVGSLDRMMPGTQQRVDNFVQTSVQDRFDRIGSSQPTQPTQPSYTPPRTNYGGTIDYQISDYAQRQMDEMQRMISNMPQFDRSSPEEMSRLAKEFAALQIDPAIGALTRGYEQTGLAIEGARGRTEAAHSGFEADMDYALGQAEKQAIERAVARGGGRAGLSEYIVAELQAPIVGEGQRIAAQHAQNLVELAQKEVLLEQQYHDQMMELEQRRGLIESQRVDELKKYEDAMVRGDWQMAMDAQSRLSQLALQADQHSQQMQIQQARLMEDMRQFDISMDYNLQQFQHAKAMDEFHAMSPYTAMTRGEQARMAEWMVSEFGIPYNDLMAWLQAEGLGGY